MNEVTLEVSVASEEIQSEDGVLVILKFRGKKDETDPAKETKK